MHYKIIFILTFFSISFGQSLFNRWTGSDPFIGSAKSNAMGSTHLINSYGSTNARFNPASLSHLHSNLIINLQLDRNTTFERWSMPVRDSFDEFLTNADYAANKNNYNHLRFGLALAIKNPNTIGKNLAGPTSDCTKVSSNLFVVLFEIISNFLITNLLIRPLKIKNSKNIPIPIKI